MTFHVDATKPQRLVEKALRAFHSPAQTTRCASEEQLAGPGFRLLDKDQAAGRRSRRTMAESPRQPAWSVTDVTEPR